MKVSVESKRGADGLAALLLFCIFTFCVLFVLLFGTRIYSSVIERDVSAHTDLNCAQYIYSQIRSTYGSVSVGEFGGIPCQYVKSVDSGYNLCNVIYVYDGWLCQLLYIDDPDADFEPQDGERILEAQSAEFKANDGMVDVKIVTASGKTVTFSCLATEKGNVQK